ncbi:hypothetical protein C4565_03940 [Candidatus Parcubacteria bacterium]|nr:MAG: hypothetical protein C4565_03940 [Candidatus Parcubacteria bacterium]
MSLIKYCYLHAGRENFIIICQIIFLLFFSAIPNGYCQNQNSLPSITLNLVQAQSTVINKKKYGFNQPAPAMMNVTYDKLSLTPDIINLNIRLFRYPGGTVANFYQWNSDSYDVNDLQDYPQVYSDYREKLFKAYGANGRKVGYESFLTWTKRDSITPLFVINMNTLNDFDDILKAFNTADALGVKVEYCELGNELYFPGQAGEKYENIDKYVLAASDAALRIKKFSKDIKIGVPISGKPEWQRGKEWDQAIQNSYLHYDAIILHEYLNVDDIPDNYVGSEAFAFVRERFPEQVRYYTQMFPGKTIWLSEWNMENRPQNNINQTFYGTLFAADFFLKLIEEPTIDIACYHRLMPHSHSILNAEYIENEVYFKKTFPYFFWKMVGEALVNATNFSNVKIVDITGTYDVRDFKALSLYSNNLFYLLLLNTSDKSIQIRHDLEGYSGLKITSLTAKNLSDTLGNNTPNTSIINSQNAALEIQPLSINLIEWTKNTSELYSPLDFKVYSNE